MHSHLLYSGAHTWHTPSVGISRERWREKWTCGRSVSHPTACKYSSSTISSMPCGIEVVSRTCCQRVGKSKGEDFNGLRSKADS